MKQITLNIDYDEPNQNSYRGFVISVINIEHPKRKRKEYRFNTGFPPIDLIEAHNFLITDIGADNILTNQWGSSVDHFVMDGDKYEWYEEEDQEWLKASKKFRKTKQFKTMKAKWMSENSENA